MPNVAKTDTETDVSGKFTADTEADIFLSLLSGFILERKNKSSI
jgi:hypothetical protein